jgi:hypothetical protein
MDLPGIAILQQTSHSAFYIQRFSISEFREAGILQCAATFRNETAPCVAQVLPRPVAFK